jgi:prefoldin subunit 5|tara:strand:+ start:649 stop:843 length:195 start_codon:yes stop_codon:yes gene_type:complete
MSVEEMAQAHLTTIQKAIDELNNQKQTIEKEILRLTDYLEQGNALINERINSTSTAIVSDSSLK